MPQNTNGGSLSTTPDSKGLNVRPDLLPESFFFLEKGQTINQNQSGKFGADGTVFRTTSKISNYTGKVYTICQGQVFLQPCGSDINKVNAILKPFNQPIKGLAIKYIVYRGLNRSDFFGTNLVINGLGVTGFGDVIRKDFTALYNMLGISEPTFTAQHIGYPAGATQSEGDLIDDYFLKISKVNTTGTTPTEETKKAFELPMIPRGTHLGTMSGGELGIDIVLNEGDYTIANDPNPFQLNLAFARKADHILDQAIGTTAFTKKLIRETATQFLDIAAFYGLHTQGKGKIYMSDNSILQTVEEIASQISDFKTAETTYLYIQSSRQRSYNFYGNQNLEGSTNNIKIGTTVNNVSSMQFEEGWPVKEFNGYPSLVIQPTTDNNDAAAMYVKQGVLHANTANEDYFIRGKNLLQEATNGVDTNFTKPIIFSLSRTNANKTVASFVQLIYEGKTVKITSETPGPNPGDPAVSTAYDMKDIDDIFGLINVKPKIQTKGANELVYVIDQNLLLIDFENKAGGKDIATVTTKKVEDLIMKNDTENLPRVTYETLLNNIRQNVGSFFENRAAYQDNSNSGSITYSDKRNNFYTPEKPYYLQPVAYTDNEAKKVTSLSLHLEDGSVSSKKILGITFAENSLFVPLIDLQQINNPKFYFRNVLEDPNASYTSQEQRTYKKYSLSVIGEDQAGKLIIVAPTQHVYVYTFDNVTFTSDEYAKWMPSSYDFSDASTNMKLPQI